MGLARLAEGDMSQNGYRQRGNCGDNCGESDTDCCRDNGDCDGDGDDEDDEDDTLLNRQAKRLSV